MSIGTSYDILTIQKPFNRQCSVGPFIKWISFKSQISIAGVYGWRYIYITRWLSCSLASLIQNKKAGIHLIFVSLLTLYSVLLHTILLHVFEGQVYFDERFLQIIYCKNGSITIQRSISVWLTTYVVVMKSRKSRSAASKSIVMTSAYRRIYEYVSWNHNIETIWVRHSFSFFGLVLTFLFRFFYERDKNK